MRTIKQAQSLNNCEFEKYGDYTSLQYVAGLQSILVYALLCEGISEVDTEKLHQNVQNLVNDDAAYYFGVDKLDPSVHGCVGGDTSGEEIGWDIPLPEDIDLGIDIEDYLVNNFSRILELIASYHDESP